jgi:AcrR family transcriptional regulator
VSTTSHRDALLLTATRLLCEREYGNITARELVAASGTNLGSIGYHFGSKEGLLNEAIGLAFEDWAEALGRTINDTAGATGPERLVATWRAILDDFDTIRPYFQAYLEAVPRSARSPVLQARLAEHYERQRDRVADLVGGPDPHNARRFATLVIAMADGLMLQAFVDREHMPTADELAAAAG